MQQQQAATTNALTASLSAEEYSRLKPIDSYMTSCSPNKKTESSSSNPGAGGKSKERQSQTSVSREVSLPISEKFAFKNRINQAARVVQI